MEFVFRWDRTTHTHRHTHTRSVLKNNTKFKLI